MERGGTHVMGGHSPQGGANSWEGPGAWPLDLPLNSAESGGKLQEYSASVVAMSRLIPRGVAALHRFPGLTRRLRLCELFLQYHFTHNTEGDINTLSATEPPLSGQFSQSEKQHTLPHNVRFQHREVCVSFSAGLENSCRCKPAADPGAAPVESGISGGGNLSLAQEAGQLLGGAERGSPAFC